MQCAFSNHLTMELGKSSRGEAGIFGLFPRWQWGPLPNASRRGPCEQHRDGNGKSAIWDALLVYSRLVHSVV